MARSSSATASLCRRRARLPKDKGGRQLDAAPSCVLSSRRRRAVSTSTDLKRLTYLVKATPATKKYRANHASQKNYAPRCPPRPYTVFPPDDSKDLTTAGLPKGRAPIRSLSGAWTCPT